MNFYDDGELFPGEYSKFFAGAEADYRRAVNITKRYFSLACAVMSLVTANNIMESGSSVAKAAVLGGSLLFAAKLELR